MQQQPPGASPPANPKKERQSQSDAPYLIVQETNLTLMIVAFWRRERVLQ
ncbi:hypothetical protein QUA81_06550 [Microcoleus sp. F6_B4]